MTKPGLINALERRNTEYNNKDLNTTTAVAMVTLTWHACKFKLHHILVSACQDGVTVVLDGVFPALINSLVDMILHKRFGPRSVSDVSCCFISPSGLITYQSLLRLASH